MVVSALKNIKHYTYVFYNITKTHGLKEAFSQGYIFYKKRFKNADFHTDFDLKKSRSTIDEILRTLPLAANDRPLIMIISDTAIQQCILYRINQKMRHMRELGLQVRFFHLKERDSIYSFMPLCKYIIIYRTAVDLSMVDTMKDSGASVLFEFDDLVVGSKAVKNSGIEREITPTQAESLNFLADSFHDVAENCDGLIVSTEFLRTTYAKSDYGLSDKKIFVVPNFIEQHKSIAATDLKYTFAYTSPSGSVRTELGFLVDFLHAFDKTATEDWNILIIGNALVFKHIAEEKFQRGTVVSAPFLQYEDYIAYISTVRCVLIPLSAHKFNFSKTPIRLMDTILAGTQAIFSPTGVYGDFADSLQKIGLVAQGDDWAAAGARAGAVLARRSENVEMLRAAMEKAYGIEAARDRYNSVFMHEIPTFLATLPKVKNENI